MEKEFIPYELALQLKELGFDEPCFGRWWSEKDFEITYTSSYDKPKQTKMAPTFSQAFRWFREKYGYDYSIKKCTPTEYRFEIEQLFVEGDNYYFIDFIFTSYEEAELECLKKLIEITKTKETC